MATLQTVLTNWMALAQPVNVVLQGNVAVYGIITDDGAVGDSILVRQVQDAGVGPQTLVPKAAIAYLSNR